jgi:AraC-like DNA-binding protein
VIEVLSNFVITEYKNIFTADDPKGRRIEVTNRYAASFIITLRGEISFSVGNEVFKCDREHPIFLPQGLSYINECIEDAHSLVFSFFTLEKYTCPVSLFSIGDAEAMGFYEKIERADKKGEAGGREEIFALLYLLAKRLFSPSATQSKSYVQRATEYMNQNYSIAQLTVSQVAASCFVSEIYLRKLFEKERGTTPFRYLTDIRMERARHLALEKRPIKEISQSVGYSDVYQFSRAYKKYFGFPPSKTV